MKKLWVLAAVAAAAVTATGGAQAVVLFNNGAAVTGVPGPTATSVIRTGGTLLGAGAQGGIPNLVGDNFAVGGLGWTVESLSFFSYQSFAASAFTFTGATWSVISGDVNTGTVVASGSSSVTNGGLQGYRVSATTLSNTDRAIFQVDVNVPDFNLPAGNYWLRWGLTGSLASGPWQPPTANGAVGNAVQSLANAAFNPVVDAGDTLGVEFPFLISGTVNPIPEPSTYALMLAGALGVLVAARRRRQG